MTTILPNSSDGVTVARLEAANCLLGAIGTLQSRFIGDAPMSAVLKETLENFLALTNSEYGFLAEALQTHDRQPYFKIQGLSDSVWNCVSRDSYSRHAPIGLEFYDLDNFFGIVLSNGKPLIVNDATALHVVRAGLPELDLPADNFLCLPITHGSEVLGIVGLANRAGGYDQDLLDFLNPLATSCGNLISANRASRWRRNVEIDLRRQALVFDNISDAIILTDRTGLILDCNPAVMEASGLPKQKLLGLPLDFLLAPQPHPEDLVQEAITAVDQRGNWKGVVSVRHEKESTLNIWQSSVLPLQDASGDSDVLVWFNRDITEHVASQAKLQERTQDLIAISELSPDGFVFIGADGLVTYVNPAFESMTGLKASNLIGISQAALAEAFTALCDTPEQTNGLLQLARPRFTILKRTVRNLIDETRKIRGTVNYFRDVTHETEVDRMKTEFLSTAAHELRTPMASIFGFAELLLNRQYSPEKAQKFLEIIHRQTGQLVTLINELLDLARIEARAGKDFHIGAHPLAPIIHTIVSEFMVPGDERAIALAIPAHLPKVMVDPEKLRLALRNVLSNAYKYSLGQGAIGLEIELRGMDGAGQVGIVVRDEGIGMTTDQAARIFDRFWRADTSGKIPGTGLGMALVKEIMGIFKGAVEIESRPGKGTRVTLWLPEVPVGLK